jgi:hypothetical protein
MAEANDTHLDAEQATVGDFTGGRAYFLNISASVNLDLPTRERPDTWDGGRVCEVHNRPILSLPHPGPPREGAGDGRLPCPSWGGVGGGGLTVSFETVLL